MSKKPVDADILVVEDDEDYREALCDMLGLEGFAALGVNSIAAFSALPNKDAYRLLLLDRNLPDGDGLEILKAHRKASSAPVVFITCEGRLEDRVAGLDADADYYLVKPVQNDELIAIVHRCMRRNQSSFSEDWHLDPVKWLLQDPELVKVAVTRTEKLLLECFADNPGVALSREEIILSLGKDPETYDYRRLEVAIRRLRKKVEDNGLQTLPLDSVYGYGYVLNGSLVCKSE